MCSVKQALTPGAMGGGDLRQRSRTSHYSDTRSLPVRCESPLQPFRAGVSRSFQPASVRDELRRAGHSATKLPVSIMSDKTVHERL